MDYHVKYSGKLLKFADKLIKMAKEFVLEGLYYLRVIDGGGTVQNRNIVEDLYKLWEQQGRLDNIKVAILPQAGSVQRTSGIYRFFSKLFTLRTDANDVAQTTANSQPYVVNGAMVNPNGASRFMTHPTVSFAANEAWSVGFMINHDNTRLYQRVFSNGGGSGEKSYFTVRSNSAGFSFNSESSTGAEWINNNKWGGKNIYYNLVAYGNGTIELFANAVSLGVRTYTPAIETFKALNKYLPFFGTQHLHTIESGALTPTQILEEYNLLRSYIPEIATTLIGTDEIATENCQMVATPMGRVINLNNTAGNVELITNAADREFSSDTGFWTKSAGATINNLGSGLLNLKSATTTVESIRRSNFLVTGSWYIITYDIKRNVNNVAMQVSDGTVAFSINSAVGDGKKHAFKAAGSLFEIRNASSTIPDIDIDNLSIVKIGWVGAYDIYTAIYNQTSGTVEQKTSAALLAAAMWRSPDADLDKQAVFGKLFNGYAAQLLQMDIDAYNAANPSTPWGYHVATLQDFQAIKDTLGGVETAGKKIKIDGNEYWTSDNGDNTSGVQALGSGYIDENGEYKDYREATGFWTVTENGDMLEVVTMRNELDELFITE